MNVGVWIVCLILLFYVFHKAHQSDRDEYFSKKESSVKKIMHSCATGMMRGCAMGLITTGPAGALPGALALGVVSPLITAYEDFYPIDKRL
jgi:hypothetical protein